MPALARLGVESIKTGGDSRSLSKNQMQTRDTFGFKWAKRDTYGSDALQTRTRKWLFDRYCGGKVDELDQILETRSGKRKIILDAGCGSAFSALLFFGDRLKKHDYLGVDISDAVWEAKKRFEEKGIPGEFFQGDISALPLPKASLDIVFSEGVLHHTDSTENTICALSRQIKPGGLFLFYVYAKKAPIREFTDDHIRSFLKNMSNEEAWNALRPLSRLGKTLGDLDLEIDVEEDIPYLGIKKGRVNLQRLFYYDICKAFYSPELDLEEMTHINFDWFRPTNCHRHTVEEIKKYCEKAQLKIRRMNVEKSGITVVGQRF